MRAAKQTQDERKQAADMKSVLAGSDKSAIGEKMEREAGAGGERETSSRSTLCSFFLLNLFGREADAGRAAQESRQDRPGVCTLPTHTRRQSPAVCEPSTHTLRPLPPPPPPPYFPPVGSLKDLLYKRRMERQLAAARGLISGPELPPDEDGGGGGAGPGGLLPTAGAKGGYVPPSVRARAAGATSGGAIMGDLPRRDDNSVRVTNLSEDTREDDLRDLFAPFGQVSRVYIAVDRESGESRGFGFVNFMFRADAQRAIDKLDGFGYDNLILRVEFAAPRPERPM